MQYSILDHIQETISEIEVIDPEIVTPVKH